MTVSLSVTLGPGTSSRVHADGATAGGMPDKRAVLMRSWTMGSLRSESLWIGMGRDLACRGIARTLSSPASAFIHTSSPGFISKRL